MERAQGETLYWDLSDLELIPSSPRMEWSFALSYIHLFFSTWSCCCFRTSEAAGPGYTTIGPLHSKNALPESAACDVEIQKCTAAFALVTERPGAADRCQMSALLLHVSLPTYPFSGCSYVLLPQGPKRMLLSISAFCVS